MEYPFLSAALQMATATDIQDIADILGVTFQEHCSATPLKAIKPFWHMAWHGCRFAEWQNSTAVILNPDTESYLLAGVPTRGSQQYKHWRGDQEGRRQRLRADGDQPEQHQVHLGQEDFLYSSFIRYISDEKWSNLFKSLAENSNVESLSAANCNLTDPICNLLCNCLEVNVMISWWWLVIEMIFQSNKSIRALNLESNSVSPEMVMNIIKSTINTKTLEVSGIAPNFSWKLL